MRRFNPVIGLTGNNTAIAHCEENQSGHFMLVYDHEDVVKQMQLKYNALEDKYEKLRALSSNPSQVRSTNSRG